MAESSISYKSSILIVPQVLEGDNYKIWSGCMKNYLLGQDLWSAVITDEAPEPNSSSRTQKNALALHAIQMSCGPKFLSLIVESESAKAAWDLLHQEATVDTSSKPEESVAGDDHKDDEFTFLDKYMPLISATAEGNWNAMEEFIKSDPLALTAAPYNGLFTCLHEVLRSGYRNIARKLVFRMQPGDLEIMDKHGYTALATGISDDCPDMLFLSKLMVSKNHMLPNLGDHNTLPILQASSRGHKELTRFLYSVTNKNILNPEQGSAGSNLLINCLNLRIYDVALLLVKEFPGLLREKSNDMYPLCALAKSFPREVVSNLIKSSDDEKRIHQEAVDFLRYVGKMMSTSNLQVLGYTNPSEFMIHGIKNIGASVFIKELLKTNPALIWVHDEANRSIFWHAVENRNHKVFNLIHRNIRYKDSLFGRNMELEDNNILHIAGMLASSFVLDRVSGAALQIQNELRWFKEVESLVKNSYKKELNRNGLTPRALFTESHRSLIIDAERWMKDVAQNSSLVGALIFTIMFTAAFTVPGGNDQETGLPMFLDKPLFKVFIMFDVLSLFSSTTSVLTFLGILTSRYAENDFLLSLPRKLVIGLSSLFFSIATMMVAFCAALSLILDGRLLYILPIVLVACVPIVVFLSLILPLLYNIFMSTFGPSIFNRNTRLPRDIYDHGDDAPHELDDLL